MKKMLFLVLSVLFLTTACGEESKEGLIDKFDKNVTSSDSYTLTGKMEITNGEDKFVYNLESNYLKDNYFKVVLINETNNHEQIILRNDSGVYVITPSLNKSFKFDSVWPDNSSQAYLLASILKDINNDEKSELLESEEGYIIKSAVNYPNNSKYVYQKVYFDSDMLPTKVEVYNENDEKQIEVVFTDINMKANLKEEDFILEEYIDQSDCEENCEEGDETCNQTCDADQTTGALDDIMYPLYIPANTTLTSSEEINSEETSRVILTFSGEKNFVLIEEASKINSDFEIIPITGNPMLLNDTIGALGTNSMYFTRNNIDYYLVSNDLSNDEMVSIATSIGNETSVISTK